MATCGCYSPIVPVLVSLVVRYANFGNCLYSIPRFVLSGAFFKRGVGGGQEEKEKGGGKRRKRGKECALGT